MTKLAVCCSHHSHRVSAALTLAGDTARFQMVRAHARRATLLLLSSVAIVGSGAACSSSSDGGEGCPRALSLNRWAAAKAFFAKPRGAESGLCQCIAHSTPQGDHLQGPKQIQTGGARVR